MLYEKIVPKDLAEFTGERLRQSLFFYKITTRVTRTSSKKMAFFIYNPETCQKDSHAPSSCMIKQLLEVIS